jgi:DNA repair exonuclease SbcCD nuclease subunit
MSKFLWVGDPHGKMSIYQEFSGFLSDLQALIEERGIEKVIIAGDLFDTFAVVRSEILALWSQFFQQVSKKTHIIALVGNHDMAGANGGVSPMEPFKAYQNVTIVDHPIQLGMNPDLHGAPFMRSNAEFEAYCRSLKPGSILICHQSFNGATFENGFYDPHGADTEAVKHLASVVSGHVHKRQEFQNIFYPGTPFQHTFGDAGENKAVFEISLGSHGCTC